MDNTQKNFYLAEQKIPKLLLKFALPCILSLLISALYNIVDQIFIGNSELGYLGNAATGIIFPILLIALAFAWSIGNGTAAYMSICQGKKEYDKIPRCIGSGISLTIAITIVLVTVFAIFKNDLLRLFGASDATIGLAVDYFNIILFALPMYMLTDMMSSVVRADGSPLYAMIVVATGAVINIILDPIFIFVLKLGIAGAAYATIIGQIVSFILCAIYFFRTKTFKLFWKCFIPRFKIFWQAVKLGISTFITQISIVIVALVCNIILFRYGTLSIYGPDIPISVISIQTKIFTIIINIVVGVVLGGQPIIGYNYGAKNYKRVHQTLKIITIISIAVGVVATIIIEFFPQLLIGMFGAGSPLYNEFAVMTFRIFMSLVTFTCLIKMFSIFFQAVGQPVKAIIISVIRDIVCFVPLVIVLPIFYGIKGALYAAPIADAIAMIVTVIVFIVYYKKSKQREAAHEKTVQEAQNIE